MPLALLGTTARVERRFFAVTGGAAVAVIFFLLIQKFQPTEAVTWGVLKPTAGPFQKSAQVSLIDDPNYLLGAMDREYRGYHFVVRGRSLNGSDLEVAILEDQKLLSFRIDASRINDHLANQSRIELRYDRDASRLLDRQTGEPVADLLSAGVASSRRSNLDLVGEAFAAEGPTSLPSEEIKKSLESANIRDRLEARDQLVRAGGASVDPLVEAIRSAGDTKSRFQATYVLYELLRKDPSNRELVTAQLRGADYPQLAALLGDPGRDVRQLSTAFLMELRDPDSFPALAHVVAEGEDPLQRYNAALVLESLLGELSEDQQREARRVVGTALQHETDERRKRMLGSFGQDRFFVVAASFKQRDAAVSEAQTLRTRSAFLGAEAYRLESGRYVTTLGRAGWAEARTMRTRAVEESIARTDAWLTPGTVFAERVFP